MRIIAKVLAYSSIAFAPVAAADPPAAGPQSEISENLSVGEHAIALLPDSDGRLHEVHYLNVNGFAVVGGDMVIGRHDQLQTFSMLSSQLIASKLDSTVLGAAQRRANAKLNGAALSAQFDSQVHTFSFGIPNRPALASGIPNRSWPTRTIPYRIDPSITDATLKLAIASAIARWNATGLVTFIDESTADAALRAKTHSLIIRDEDGEGLSCRAQTGYAPAAADQFVLLNPPCDEGKIVHELGHSLGLRHEHMRPDRATFVTIASWISVTDENYGILPGEYYSTYDPCSIMQYPESDKLQLTAAGKVALATCQKTLSNQSADCIKVGQRCQLSPYDLAAVEARFKDTPLN